MTVPFLDVGASYRELKEDIDVAMARVLDSGWFVLGEEVERFEQAFAAYCDATHAVGVGNGLDALHLALRAAGIGPGDEVIVPGNTFIATALAVTYAGAELVLVEPDPVTHNLDPNAVPAAMTEKTAAIIAVDLYGMPADLYALRRVARAHGVLFIEDAAQAHGARLDGARVGSIADVTTFSFYPGKNLGAFGDGGAVTTNDEALASKLRSLRNYGSTVKYHHDDLGFNSRLDTLQAAILGVKLAHLDAWNARRAAMARGYREALGDLDGLTLPEWPDDRQGSWHLFVVRHRRRDALRQALRDRSVATQIHYPIPVHLTGAYANLGYREGQLPVTEDLAQQVLSLPISPHHSDEEHRMVVDAVRAACAEVS